MVQRTTVSASLLCVYVITRFMPSGTCDGNHFTVIAVIAVATLRPRLYEQIFTRFHSQNIEREHGVDRQGKRMANLNFEAVAKFLSEILLSGLLLTLNSSRSSKTCQWTHHFFGTSFQISPSPDAPAHPSRNDSARCERSYEHCHVHLLFGP